MMGTFKIMGAYTDHIIRPVLLQLSETEDTVTYTMIAEETGIPYYTIKHSVHRMLKRGEIAREGGGRRWGYKYRELKS